MKLQIKLATLLICNLFILNSSAQNTPEGFKEIIQLPHTSIKNQGSTGTCWSFATTSFIESEALRLNKDTFNLSEMYFVHHAYTNKLMNYISKKGKVKYGPGGLSHDITKIIESSGIVPEYTYLGNTYNTSKHDHRELNKLLTSFTKTIANTTPTTNKWFPAYTAILDTYLGTPPANIIYQSKSYTPQQFASDIVGFVPSNYIELSSFLKYENYTQFTLDVPDNWDKTDNYYNLPLTELMTVMQHALENGFTIAWDGDVSEPGFRYNSCIANTDSTSTDSKKNFTKPAITPQSREKMFNNHSTTDDHLMHIVGLAKNKHGRKYFIVKNSWGATNSSGGYLYMSIEYAKAKTVAIMVHKNALPKRIYKKLKL